MAGVRNGLVRMRRLAVDEPDLARARPFGLEVVDRRNDRADDARHQRKAALRIEDRIGEHVARLERAVVAQQQHPAVERARHDGGQQARSGHLRAGPSRSSRSTVASAGNGPCPQMTSGACEPARCTIAGNSPPGPLRCGSTICSTKPAADRGIEGVSAALENRHAGLRRKPVRRRHRAERAADIRSCRERRLHRASAIAWIRAYLRRAERESASRAGRASRAGIWTESLSIISSLFPETVAEP